ncbi:MAG: nuclear transport factor 2 family protein [Proteobacteria bacterium]|nr:MAG: nuclear transport factor 2 family protein [Pseudomonadota bacterium]
MSTTRDTLIDLETRFWRSMMDEDTDSSVEFDHSAYRRMTQQGAMVLTSYQLSDIDVTFEGEDTAILTYRVRQEFAPRGRSSGIAQEMAETSTWLRQGGQWQCVMHTETPLEAPPSQVAVPRTN